MKADEIEEEIPTRDASSKLGRKGERRVFRGRNEGILGLGGDKYELAWEELQRRKFQTFLLLYFFYYNNEYSRGRKVRSER